jgi:hypothetical protein
MWDGQGLKDPCISHVDASHAEWPRTESSLLFLKLFLESQNHREKLNL